ncbi:MAG: HEAT repeat domain-containing protein, partial [Armatimonadota bacterium]
SPDEQRRWEAVFLLSVVHDADTWNRLRPLARDPAKQVRKQVAVTYAQLGDRRAVPTLVEMLDDAEPDVRARAAMALGKTGGAGVIDALQTRLKMEQDKRVRAAISVAIRLVEHAKQ